MRIGLNMMFLGAGLAGGRVYCEGLLRGLERVDTANEFLLFTRSDLALPDLPPERFSRFRAPVSMDSSYWRTIWEYTSLPRQVRKQECQLVHALGLSPFVTGCPFVLTVYDLNYLHFPATVPFAARMFMNLMLPRLARRADRVIAISQHTAGDVARYFKVPEERIRVIPLGPGQECRPVEDADFVSATQKKYAIHGPYVFSLSRAYVHKNLAGLLQAFARIHPRFPEVRLVLAGDRYVQGHALDQLVSELGLSGAVIFTGYLQDQQELNALLTGAAVFAFPSLAEGFGLPVLEAMACGVPVVASNLTSIPEVVGDAGLLADPRDPEAFGAALTQILNDAALRQDLRARGLARCRQFSWDQCARMTLEVYRELL